MQLNWGAYWASKAADETRKSRDVQKRQLAEMKKQTRMMEQANQPTRSEIAKEKADYYENKRRMLEEKAKYKEAKAKMKAEQLANGTAPSQKAQNLFKKFMSGELADDLHDSLNNMGVKTVKRRSVSDLLKKKGRKDEEK